jgi:hypothetical protein
LARNPAVTLASEHPGMSFVLPEEPATIDPYGDVALGVECAWPESLPQIELEAVVLQDASISFS